MFWRVVAFSFVLLSAEQLFASALPERKNSQLENLPALFSTDYYPDEAVKAEEEGTTAADLGIAPNGKVVRCVVTESASPALDARTCSVIQERASYPPVRDARGRLIATSDRVRIHWVLPDEPDQLFADGWLEVKALVPIAGLNRCTVTASGPTPIVSQAVCDQMVRSNATYRPSAVATPFLMTIREEHLVGEGTPPKLEGEGLARVVVRKRIDASGRVVTCSLVPDPSDSANDRFDYRCNMSERYVPLADDEPNRGDRVMTDTWMRSFATLPAGK